MNRTAMILALVCCGAIVATKLSAAEEKGAASDAAVVDQLPVGRTISRATEYEQRIQLALDRPFTHEFDGVTLAEVVKLLEATVKCNVIVDRSALEGENIELETTLSGKASGGALRRELRDLLTLLNLDFVVRNDSLWITTQEKAENFLPLRLYQVHDLVMDPSEEQYDRTKYTALLELIPDLIAPGTWRDHSGSWGEIRSIEVPGVMALAIMQNAKNHEEIEKLLAQLRAARLKEVERIQEPPALPVEQSKPEKSPIIPVPSRLPRGKVIYSQAAGDAEVRKALARPATFDWVDVDLADVAAEIRKKHDIRVELDIAQLTADGKGPDTKISLRWQGGSLGNALRMLLAEQGLAFRLRDGVLLITTTSGASIEEPIYVYQVHDLLSSSLVESHRRADYNSLIELVRGVVTPEVWREGGGYVGIQPLEAPGLQVLTITTQESTHEEVEQLFEMIRDAYEPKVHELQLRRPKVVVPKHPAVRGMGGGF